DRVESVFDVGVGSADDGTFYPDIATAAAEKSAAGEADRALLICGTGLGVSIAANRVSGVRAVTAHDLYSVQRSVQSNIAQLRISGQPVVGLQSAEQLGCFTLGRAIDPITATDHEVAAIRPYDGSLEPPCERPAPQGPGLRGFAPSGAGPDRGR